MAATATRPQVSDEEFQQLAELNGKSQRKPPR
jgi:hypothetical protein